MSLLNIAVAASSLYVGKRALEDGFKELNTKAEVSTGTYAKIAFGAILATIGVSEVIKIVNR